MAGDDEIDFKFLAEQSVDVICLSGFDRIVRYISPSCFQLLGYRPEELIGKGPEAYILADDMPLLVPARERILASRNLTDITTIRMQRKDGAIVWVEINVRLVLDPLTGKPKQHVIMMRDVTESKKMVDRLSALALFDSLTNLANRRAFDAVLEREWKRTTRAGSQLSIVLLDIDHFKEFNDLYGHVAGDEALRAVADVIATAVRTTDTIARYGGDEMAIILPDTDSAGAMRVAEKVRAALVALELPHAGNTACGGFVTVSVGAATALARQGGAATVVESLILAADSALYKAKDAGRNRVASAVLIAAQEIDEPAGNSRFLP